MFVNILVLRVWVCSYGLSWKHKEKITLGYTGTENCRFSVQCLKFGFPISSAFHNCSWLSSVWLIPPSSAAGQNASYFQETESQEPWVWNNAESEHIPHLQKMPPATDVTAPLPTGCVSPSAMLLGLFCSTSGGWRQVHFEICILNCATIFSH